MVSLHITPGLAGATLSALLLFSGLIAVSCSLPDQRLEAANLQSIELTGKITVVDRDGQKVPTLTTEDGLVYSIVGKLDRMLRDFYRNQTIRLSGKIESDASAAAPGVFRVEEIILEIR